jgi:transcriptional repressor NrdR
MQVAKKNESFEPFSREKIMKAIQAACIKRPISLSDIETVVAKIERRLQEQGERIVPSRDIGDMTMEYLKNIDHVAYVRFASIYKDFKDPEEFRAALEGLKATATVVN